MSYQKSLNCVNQPEVADREVLAHGLLSSEETQDRLHRVRGRLLPNHLAAIKPDEAKYLGDTKSFSAAVVPRRLSNSTSKSVSFHDI